MNEGAILSAAIICDSQVLSLQLCRLLSCLGCTAEIFACNPGRKLLENADIVFIELMQAGDKGFALLRALNTELSAPLVLLSGTGRISDLHWGKAAGATAVLEHPVEEAKLAGLLALCRS
jgi:CheY-like chemotaxis protein